jgi:hypothetical protein
MLRSLHLHLNKGQLLCLKHCKLLIIPQFRQVIIYYGPNRHLLQAVRPNFLLDAVILVEKWSLELQLHFFDGKYNRLA